MWRSFLLAALLALSPRRQPPTFSRVMQNGSLMNVTRSTLNLTGPFTCSDNSLVAGGGSTDCSCPNTGVAVTVPPLQFTLARNGETDVQAPWVTADTVVVCMPMGSVPIRLAFPRERIKPGVGFTVIAEAPEATLGIINIACIGAVPQ